jgi:hypothetical protein
MHPVPYWQDVAIKAAMYAFVLWFLLLGILMASGDRNGLRAMRWMVGKRKAKARFEAMPTAKRRQAFLFLGWGFVIMSVVILVDITRAFTRHQ